jgi:CelD/BcsL family acetyltransferase involved in cellulose biosynthesis
MARLRVETIDSLPKLEAIEPEWRDLWQHDPTAGPFQAPDWLLPWTRHLWRGGSLRVLALRDGGDLVAVAPLFLWGTPTVRMSFLGAGVSDELGMLARPPFETEAARVVLESLAEATEWQVCELDELRPDSPLARTEPPPGLNATHTQSSVCPALRLPESAEELMGSLAPKFRKNLRQAETRLRRLGAEFVTARPEDAPEFLAALFRLHAARWSLRREPGMLSDDSLQRFHLEAAERMAGHGILRLHAIRLDRRIIAVQHNLWHNRRLCYYLSGFDPEHARLSPGSVLLAWTIRAAIDERAVELDFLRHREQYKYQWGAIDRVHRKLLVRHSTAYERDVA